MYGVPGEIFSKIGNPAVPQVENLRNKDKNRVF